MATRKTHSRKVYVNATGEESRSAKSDWAMLRFDFLTPEKDEKGSYGVVRSFEVRRDELPEDMASCAMGHGLSQKLGDNMAGIEAKAKALNEDGGDFSYDEETGWADLMETLLEDQWSDIKGGVWVAESEGKGSGTGSVTVLMQAIAAAYVTAGQPLTEDQLQNIKTQKLATEEGRKSFRKHPAIEDEYLRIMQERAEERRKKAQKAASAEGTVDLGTLLG